MKLLRVFNWTDNKWPWVLGSAKELIRIVASSTTGVSPYCAWYGTIPSMRMLPGDRVAVPIRNGTIKALDNHKLTKVMYCTYLYKNNSTMSTLIVKSDYGHRIFSVPTREIRVVERRIPLIIEEGTQIYKEPDSIDKQLTKNYSDSLEIGNIGELINSRYDNDNNRSLDSESVEGIMDYNEPIQDNNNINIPMNNQDDDYVKRNSKSRTRDDVESSTNIMQLRNGKRINMRQPKIVNIANSSLV